MSGSGFIDLRETYEGPVFLRGDDGFDAEIAGFQTAFDNKPCAVIGATNPEDVRKAVIDASRLGLGVAVQATGHGRPRTELGGILVNTKRMTALRVDPAARTAELAAGVKWQDVIAQSVPHGLVPTSGSAPDVGAVGYTLGGGMGILARQFGYSADHVQWIDLVTADGELRRVTGADAADAELFWALRGAGSGFGIVTGMAVDLMPLEQLYGGGLYFDTELIPRVLELFARWTRSLPNEMTSSISLLRYPDVPMIPTPIRGRLVAHARFAFAGPASIGEDLVAPFRQLGPRLIDTVKAMSFLDSGSIYNDPPMPHAYIGTNSLLKDLDDDVLRAAQKVSAVGPPVMCVVDIRHMGGAMAHDPAVPNAIGHREAKYIARVLSPVGPTGLEPIVPLHRQFLDDIKDRALGVSPNFVYGHEADESLVRSMFGAAVITRLQALKRSLDPKNVFRLNHGVTHA